MIQSLVTGSSFLLFGTAIQAAAAFAANLIMMRYLMPDEVGHFAIILAVTGLVFTLGTLKIDICALRLPEADFTEAVRRRYFTASLYETAGATALICIILIASDYAEAPAFLLVAAAATNHFIGVQKGFFMRRLPYLQLAVVETSAQLGGHVIGTLSVLGGLGSMSLYIREASAAAMGMAGLALVGGAAWVAPIRFTRSDWGALWRDARAVWLDSVLEGVFQRLSVMAATAVAGAYGAGLVFQAQRLAVTPHQLAIPILRAASAWFSRTEGPAQRRQVCRWFFFGFLALLVPAAAILAAYADPLVPFLFGSHWAPAASVLAAMAALVPSLTAFELLRVYALADRRHRPLIQARVSQLVGFALPFVLIMLGVAATAELVGYALALAYLCAMLTLLPLTQASRR